MDEYLLFSLRRWHDLFLKLGKTPAACWQWPQLEACFTIWAKGYHFLTELLSGPVWGREFLLLMPHMLYHWQRLLQHSQRSQRPWCSQGWAAMPLKVSLTYCYNPHSCFVWKSRSVNSPSGLCFTLDSVSQGWKAGQQFPDEPENVTWWPSSIACDSGTSIILKEQKGYLHTSSGTRGSFLELPFNLCWSWQRFWTLNSSWWWSKYLTCLSYLVLFFFFLLSLSAWM